MSKLNLFLCESDPSKLPPPCNGVLLRNALSALYNTEVGYGRDKPDPTIRHKEIFAEMCQGNVVTITEMVNALNQKSSYAGPRMRGH